MLLHSAVDPMASTYSAVANISPTRAVSQDYLPFSPPQITSSTSDQKKGVTPSRSPQGKIDFSQVMLSSESFRESKRGVVGQPNTTSEVLYEAVIPVRYSATNHDDKLSELTITICLQTHSQSSTIRTLHIRITDERDPFFLHTLNVTETEFHSLKKEQSLLVDFSMFPHNLIQLLTKCLESKDEEIPRFLAVFNTSNTSTVFSIVETNQFKHLQHIALRFVPANDTTLKQYLADRLTMLKAKQQELTETLASTQEALEQRSLEVEQGSKQLQTIDQDTKSRISDLQNQHMNDLTNVKEKAMADESQLRSNFRQELQQAEEAAKQKINELSSQCQELQLSNRDLTETKYKLENSVQQTNNALKSTEEELVLCRAELKNLREQNSSMDKAKFQQDKEINSKNLRLAQLEQEVKDKSDLIDNMTSMLRSVQEQKEGLNDSLELFKSNYENAELKLKDCVSEINKGNHIIQGLQSEVRSLRSKLKLNASVIQQQEQLIQEKEKGEGNWDRQLKDTKRDCEDQKIQCQRLQEALQTTREQLEEARKQLGTSTQVINWLNKELNSSKMGHLGASMPMLPSSSSTNLSASMNSSLTSGIGAMSNLGGRLGNANSVSASFSATRSPLSSSHAGLSGMNLSSSMASMSGYSFSSSTPSSSPLPRHTSSSTRTTPMLSATTRKALGLDSKSSTSTSSSSSSSFTSASSSSTLSSNVISSSSSTLTGSDAPRPQMPPKPAARTPQRSTPAALSSYFSGQ